VATTSFTDGNITVRARNGANALVVTFPANSVNVYNNTTCTDPVLTSNANQFNTPSNANQFQASGVAAGNAQSVKIAAPSPVTIGGTTYNFSSWSGTAGSDNLVVSPTGCISRTAPGSGTNDPA
jgi:hypothetical protein